MVGTTIAKSSFLRLAQVYSMVLSLLAVSSARFLPTTTAFSIPLRPVHTLCRSTLSRQTTHAKAHISEWLFGSSDSTDNIQSMKIVKYPHPALRAENANIDLEELARSPAKREEITNLAQTMLQTMYESHGVGLAAPQVGINLRLMVYNPTGDDTLGDEETIWINPQIVESSSEQDADIEGCLSFPDMSGTVHRPDSIKVETTNLQGETRQITISGWEARIFQHEYDHLQGVLYVDRLSPQEKEDVAPRLQELIQEYGPGGAL